MAYTNLQYLRTITENNKEIIREMIEMFVLQVPDFVGNLNRYYENKQFSALAKEAHKAKSSLQIMGMTDLEAEMKRFQMKAIEGSDTESYLGHIHSFEHQCKMAIEELKEELKSL